MHRKTILVVDDDLGIRESVVELLEYEGYKCVAASQGRDALRILALINPPDLIILDLQMPVMSGQEFLQVRQNDPRLIAIPVLVCSGIADWTTSTGMTGLLKKPFDTWVLIRKVEQIIGAASTTRHGPVASMSSSSSGR